MRGSRDIIVFNNFSESSDVSLSTCGGAYALAAVQRVTVDNQRHRSNIFNRG